MATADVWEYATRNLTFHNDVRTRVYPTGAAGTTVTGGAGAWVSGAWTQVVPAAEIENDCLLMALSYYCADLDSGEAALEIGYGASNTVVAEIHFNYVGQQGANFYTLPFPVRIPAGERIMARLTDVDLGGLNLQLKVIYAETQDVGDA